MTRILLTASLFLAGRCMWNRNEQQPNKPITAADLEEAKSPSPMKNYPQPQSWNAGSGGFGSMNHHP